MSQYKIDGHILSVNEFFTWVNGFVVLYRKGMLKKKKLPKEVVRIMKENSVDKDAAMKVLAYLKKDEDFLNDLIAMVQEGATELALEKMK